jgi:hypothetical protein
MAYAVGPGCSTVPLPASSSAKIAISRRGERILQFTDRYLVLICWSSKVVAQARQRSTGDLSIVIVRLSPVACTTCHSSFLSTCVTLLCSRAGDMIVQDRCWRVMMAMLTICKGAMP